MVWLRVSSHYNGATANVWYTIYKLFNVKLAYLAAVFIFEVGSLLCAVAPSSTVFIVGRAIAGVSQPPLSFLPLQLLHSRSIQPLKR